MWPMLPASRPQVTRVRPSAQPEPISMQQNSESIDMDVDRPILLRNETSRDAFNARYEWYNALSPALVHYHCQPRLHLLLEAEENPRRVRCLRAKAEQFDNVDQYRAQSDTLDMTCEMAPTGRLPWVQAENDPKVKFAQRYVGARLYFFEQHSKLGDEEPAIVLWNHDPRERNPTFGGNLDNNGYAANRNGHWRLYVREYIYQHRKYEWKVFKASIFNFKQNAHSDPHLI